MLIKLTAFDPLDHRSTEPIELDSREVSAISAAKTGDGYDYTVVALGEMVYGVHESVQQVSDLVEEANK